MENDSRVFEMESAKPELSDFSSFKLLVVAPVFPRYVFIYKASTPLLF